MQTDQETKYNSASVTNNASSKNFDSSVTGKFASVEKKTCHVDTPALFHMIILPCLRIKFFESLRASSMNRKVVHLTDRSRARLGKPETISAAK